MQHPDIVRVYVAGSPRLAIFMQSLPDHKADVLLPGGQIVLCDILQLRVQWASGEPGHIGAMKCFWPELLQGTTPC